MSKGNSFISKIMVLVFVLTSLAPSPIHSLAQPSKEEVVVSETPSPDYETLNRLESLGNQEEPTLESILENRYIVTKRKGIESSKFINTLKAIIKEGEIKNNCSIEEFVHKRVEKLKKEKEEIKQLNNKTNKKISRSESSNTDSNQKIFDSSISSSTILPTTYVTQQPISTPKMDKPLTIINELEETFVIEASEEEVEKIKKLPDVKRVERDQKVQAYSSEYTPWGLKAINASYSHKQSIKGGGIDIGIIDSGVIYHPLVS